MGEFVTASGVVVNGDIPRFFAGDPTAGFLAGGFLFKMFGLPAAAIAMWRSAKTENQKVVGGIMMSAALTSFLTGITEPIEFSLPVCCANPLRNSRTAGRHCIRDHQLL